MRLVIPSDNPSIVRLFGLEDNLKSLESSLTYSDKSAKYQLTKFKGNPSMFQWLGQEKYEAQLKALTEAAKPKSILFQDEVSSYTYSGMASYLSKKFRVEVTNEVSYPKFKKLAWAKMPKFQMYPDQEDALEKLLEVRHGGVSLATGTGKSFIIQNMLREMGLQAVVMTPSTSISDQLYRQFVEAFGKAKVGKFFDGKKELGKLITVANAQSLTKIQVDTPAWEFFSKSQVFFSDESHQCPAATLESVCFGLAKQAPYRFFFSATQIRNDGKDVVLDGITGPIVKTLTVREGVEKKYLAKPRFMMLEVESDLVVFSRDPGVLTRKHLYYNPKVVKAVANLVNQSVAKGMPTVVLIEEIEQFGMLLPYLETKPLFAHGALTDVNKKVVPPEYWDSDPNQLVAEFNDFKCPILVGTSCISTGTDIREVKSLVYWQGGKSEVQTKQSIGRGTRLTPTKSSFAVFDFDIINVDLLHRHAEARARIYEEMYGPVNYVEA